METKRSEGATPGGRASVIVPREWLRSELGLRAGRGGHHRIRCGGGDSEGWESAPYSGVAAVWVGKCRGENQRRGLQNELAGNAHRLF